MANLWFWAWSASFIILDESMGLEIGLAVDGLGFCFYGVFFFDFDLDLLLFLLVGAAYFL